MSPRMAVPSNITLMRLPAECPELNRVENIWQFMRDNWLSNRVFQSYQDIVDHGCHAWSTPGDTANILTGVLYVDCRGFVERGRGDAGRGITPGRGRVSSARHVGWCHLTCRDRLGHCPGAIFPLPSGSRLRGGGHRI
jgi:hypothetical protein